jgi:uncharacterized protein
MHARAAELIATLDLQPHPEGGYYREIFRSPFTVSPQDARGTRSALTSIYFLLVADSWSRWHKVTGGPLELLELDAETRTLDRRVLGTVGSDGAAPAHVVAAGRWQAARPLGDYALMGCTVGPGFEFADFTMLSDDAAVAETVRSAWPDLVFLI